MDARHHLLTRSDAHRGSVPIGGALRRLVALAFCCLTLHSVSAAPYPPDGMPTEWVQPDGTPLKLRVFGDEFYGRTTTLDGYTVIFSAADMTYYYAMTGADGKSLVASDVAADMEPPKNLPQQLREADETVSATRAENIREYAPERAANWAARVKAVQLQRAPAAGLAPAGEAAAPAPAGVSVANDVLAAPVSGARVGLVILVQFPDDTATTGSDPTSFPTTQTKMARYCNETGYTDDGNTGSIRDYYHDQSNNLLTFTQVVTPIVTLPHPRNYYNFTDYPTNSTLPNCGVSGRLMVADAVAKLITDGFDFSALSLDATYKIIATSLLFAGNDSGVWPKGLWPHSYSVPAPGINVGTAGSPRYVYSYQCTNVPTAAPAIGTVCHELGHLLMKYPDFYDTDASDGESQGVGEHCLMGSGNWLNSQKTPAPIDLYLKDFSGWANITNITPTQSLDVALPSTGNRGYRILKPGSTTEYFLLENRGAGDKWATSCRDKGIAIWHVDEAVTTDNQHQQRTSAQHYELSLEQADGLFDLENNQDRGDGTDLYDSTTGLFHNGTSPNANWWSGTASGISISVLSAPGADMNVRFGTGTPTTTLSINPTTQSVAAGGASPGFTVTSNTTWNWSDDASWVTSGEALSQTGDQTFTYTVAANSTASSRTAVITLTGGGLTRTHTITQSGVVVDDHGNSIATATWVGQNSSTNGNIETAADNDYFRINVTGSGSLLIETTGVTDTYGYLLDSSGNPLVSDDDSGVETNFRISYAVTSGTYYVRVVHYNSTAGTGSYLLVSSFAATATLAVSPTTQSVVAGGATLSFNASSNTSWLWSVNTGWVTSGEATSQSGNQTFTYTVSANPLATPRTAVITLTAGALSATHTITQAGSSADDHGNSMAAATVIGQNSSTNGNIETAGDPDYFRINFTGGGFLTVETTGGTDTYGYLLDAFGNELVSDDDSGVDTNFRISQALPAGTYYVRVTHYSPTGTGSYQLVSSVGTDDDHGNNIATATLIEQDSSTSGNIETDGDNDYFRINVSGNGSLTVETTGVTDTYGYLLDASGNALVSDDDSGVDTNFQINRAVTAGTYYVRVTHYSTTGTGSYQLVSSFVPTDDHGDSIVTATPLPSATGSAVGVLTEGDEDYFRVTAPGPGILIAWTEGSTDTYGYIYRDDGTILDSNDDDGMGLNCRMSCAVVAAGNYYVMVRGYGSTTTGTYTVHTRFISSTAPIQVTYMEKTENDVNLGFTGISGVLYYIQGSTDLKTWTLISMITGTGAENHATLSGDGEQPKRYFRVSTTPP